MIFVGDIALGDEDIALELPNNFFKKKLIGNLEGGIINNGGKRNSIVYNSTKNRNLFSKFYLFCLANNHIFDDGQVLSTINFLKNINVPYTGLLKRKKNNYFEDDKYIFLNFGWSVIEAKGKKNGYKINPLNKRCVLNTINSIIKEKKYKKIICIFHWGFELELYPQPLHRQLAHELIDLGVSLIIGHHSHRVQGVEVYKGVPIVYGLGNFLFSQNTFFSGKHKFPDDCNLELAFEYDENMNHILHWIVYDRMKNNIKYVETELLSESKRILQYSKFVDLSDNEYEIWFKANRIKRVLLPIYYYSDSVVLISFKNCWVYLRQILIRIMLKFNIKKWK